MNVLVTGGAGYIATHTIVLLQEAGHSVIALDNLSNSSEKAIERVISITGKPVLFYKCDILDKDGMREIFSENKIDAVIHFAGKKAVGESVREPLMYYYNNIAGTINLLEVMAEFDVKKIVFSSSATVYGIPEKVPLTEDMPTSAINPYGRTKLIIEGILQDLYSSDSSWSISILRYFNPIGAHPSGKIGENPKGIPNNLMPYITQVACGRIEELPVYGSDYPTHDGTGVRDYIHVMDLSDGHLKALEYVDGKTGVFIHNLGTGKGYSVFDIISAFERATGVKIPYTAAPRRAGDAAVCYSDVEKSKKELGFAAKYDIEEMCRDSWNWQRNNPNGYED